MHAGGRPSRGLLLRCARCWARPRRSRARRARPRTATSVRAPTTSATPASRRRQHRHARDVAKRLRARDLVVAQQHEHRRGPSRASSALAAVLRRRLVVGRGVDHRDAAAPRVHAERRAQRAPARLAVDLHRVVARSRAERDAAAGPVRRADRAGARAAGALLAPGLRAAAADLAAASASRRCRAGARAARRARPRRRRALWNGSEKISAGSSTVPWPPSRGALGSGLSASRTSTTAPSGPGTAPRSEQQVALGVDVHDLEARAG